VRVKVLRSGRLVYWLRFRAQGRRQSVRLGTDAEGWNEQRADIELERVLGQVERGTWRPPASRARLRPAGDPTFHEYASGWLARNAPKLGARRHAFVAWASVLSPERSGV
jgi:hypothetical protein